MESQRNSKPLFIDKLKKKYYKNNQGVIQENIFENVVTLYLENFQEESEDCYKFLQKISQPKSYQEFIQIFEITSSSIYAAIIIGVSIEDILEGLQYYSKDFELSNEIIEFLQKTGHQFGKCLLILQNQTYFLEAEDKKVLQYYESLQSLQGCFSGSIYQIIQSYQEPQQNISQLSTNYSQQNHYYTAKELSDIFYQEEEEKKFIKKVFRLQIHSEKLTQVLISRDNQLNKYKYMMSQQYEYESDLSPGLEIALKQHIKVWPYQESCIQWVFVDKRAKSGIIVLPCGAGKTLVGILCICQIQKRTLILCINNLNVKQWQKQILNFTNISQKRIILFTSETTKMAEEIDLEQPCIVITTYSILSRRDELKSQMSLKFMEKIKQQQWSLLLLDEVQVAPAEVFKEAFLIKTQSHCKIGLTATLIREDTKIEDLQFFIGPKLFEESWINLTNQGYLAKVQCIDILCEMPQDYLRVYQQQESLSKSNKILLYTANPNKFYILKYLLEIHQQKKDKILVFIDTVEILVDYAKRLECPYISGEVSEYEREQIINLFKHTDDWNVLFISWVGDVGIDLPDANVAIEISSLFGSRRQKTQRLGRIIRPKSQTEGEFHAVFYSLISLETEDTIYSAKRQKYLAKQGYEFKSIYQKQISLEKYKTEETELYFQNYLNQIQGKNIVQNAQQSNQRQYEQGAVQKRQIPLKTEPEKDPDIFMDFEQIKIKK